MPNNIAIKTIIKDEDKAYSYHLKTLILFFKPKL